MKIDVSKIAADGIIQQEDLMPSDLELDTDIAEFHGPIKIEADISKITNAVTVELSLNALMGFKCSRCLEELEFNFSKEMTLNYAVDKPQAVIDLNPDIREEIILSYPLKPLCRPACKGLCPKCGKNLNEGGCSCAIT